MHVIWIRKDYNTERLNIQGYILTARFLSMIVVYRNATRKNNFAGKIKREGGFYQKRNYWIWIVLKLHLCCLQNHGRWGGILECFIETSSEIGIYDKPLCH